MSKFHFGIVGNEASAANLRRAIAELPASLMGKFFEKARETTSLRGQFSKLMKSSDPEADWSIRIKGVDPSQDDFRLLLTHLQGHGVDLSTIKCSGDKGLVNAFNDLNLNIRQTSPATVVGRLSDGDSSDDAAELTFEQKRAKLKVVLEKGPDVPKSTSPLGIKKTTEAVRKWDVVDVDASSLVADDQVVSSPVTFSYENSTFKERMRLKVAFEGQLGDSVRVSEAGELIVSKSVSSNAFQAALSIATKSTPFPPSPGLDINKIVLQSTDMSSVSNPILKAYSLAKDSLVNGTPLVQTEHVARKAATAPAAVSTSERKSPITAKTGGVDTNTVMEMVAARNRRVEAARFKQESENIRNSDGGGKADDQTNKPK